MGGKSEKNFRAVYVRDDYCWMRARGARAGLDYRACCNKRASTTRRDTTRAESEWRASGYQIISVSTESHRDQSWNNGDMDESR